MFGVIAFIVTLLFLVLVHEWGHFIVARKLGVKVEEFGFGFPPRIAKKHWRGTDYTLNWLPFGGFVRLKGEEDADKSPDSYASQTPWRRSLIVLAGVFMNLIVAAVLLSVVAGVGGQQDITAGVSENAIVSNVSHVVVEVVPGGPAAATLEAGDRITQINGEEFLSLTALQDFLQTKNDAVKLNIMRGEELLSVNVTPASFTVDGGDAEFYGIGAQLQSVGSVRYAWSRAPLEGVRMTTDVFVLIATTLWDALIGLFTDRPTVGLDVTGPVGIAVLTGDIVKLGVITFMQFVAILSINLAFLNLLPIPALDGGRFAFLLLEMVRRRPVSEKLELKLHQVGFSLLLLLVIVVTIIDIGRFSDGLTNFIQGIF